MCFIFVFYTFYGGVRRLVKSFTFFSLYQYSALVLSPDAIWSAIVKSIASHVSNPRNS